MFVFPGAADFAVIPVAGPPGRQGDKSTEPGPIGPQGRQGRQGAAGAGADYQITREVSSAPDDIPVGQHCICWNSTLNRPALYMNRGGTIIDGFDPSYWEPWLKAIFDGLPAMPASTADVPPGGALYKNGDASGFVPMVLNPAS